MKKLFALLAVSVLALTALTGCSAATYKVGTGIINHVEVKTAQATADANGRIDVNTYIATVAVDKDGKIVSAFIDVAQASRLGFDATGLATIDETYDARTKQQKGADYGMIGNSEIGKEWYEQANAFAAYVVGMTGDEVAAIEVTEEGDAVSEDILAGTTVTVTDYIAVIVEAYNNATTEVEAASVGTGVISHVDVKTAQATADAAGRIDVNTYVANVALDKDGKIVSAFIDVAQSSRLGFDATGLATIDETYDARTKQQKGADYGMIGNSEIGKEWYEQANAFAAYVVGMTAAEVAAIEVTEEGGAVSEDILAGTTVTVSDYIAVIVAAAENAAAIAE